MAYFVKLKLLVLCLCVYYINCYRSYGLSGFGGQSHSHNHNGHNNNKLKTVFSWKGVGFDIGWVHYLNTTDTEGSPNVMNAQLPEAQRFYIPYNNVPIGLEVFNGRGFVTVPRRRYGIPSTLNYIDFQSPLLRPYPDAATSKRLVSTYRPRADSCGRLWVVDTGLLEVPGARKQVQPPAIVVFDLRTDKQILRYELKSTDLVNERTPAGLTSITVDVDPRACDDAYAYINDLATEGLVVFSLKQMDSWRVSHPSFKHNEAALNFSVAGFTIPWQDGLFSIALSVPDVDGNRRAYFHPLVSTEEFVVDTKLLKSRKTLADADVQNLGTKGHNTQSGSHAYHSPTNTLLFANVAQDAILCWNVDKEMTPENVAVVLQDHQKLVYISDLKVVHDNVWVLVNQIPRFVYSTLDPNKTNYYIHRANIPDLIRGTVCEGPRPTGHTWRG